MSSIYRKGEVLGWGSVAVVHAGWDELLDRRVAIKELKHPFAGNETFARAFRAQALRMLDISHRHVLATYSVDSDHNAHSVVRELADETVSQKSFHGPMEPETVLRILRGTLLGLDVLHGRDLVHRAVKPENMFFCNDVCKIGDFGLPALEGVPPSPARRYRYSASEEILLPESASPASDIYSLGFVAYELILGPLRFEQVVEELLRTVGESREPGISGGSRDNLWPRFHVSTLELPPLLDLEPGVPAALSLTLQKMVAKDGTARFANCRQVLAALGSVTPELPTGTQSMLMIRENAPPSSTSNGSWALIAGGAIATSAILALSIWALVSYRHVPQLSSSDQPGQSQSSSILDQAEQSATASPLASLVSQNAGAAIALDPPRSGALPVLALGTPLSFRVTAERSGYLLIFDLSPDGSITCLYPNSNRPSLAIGSGESLVLPSREDPLQGLLVASAPLGRETIFLLHSPTPLPSLPSSQDSSDLLRTYPAGSRPDDPAPQFVDWISNLLRERPEARLTSVEFEVRAAR